MNTLEYLAAIKARRSIDSDYGLAKELGVAKQTISNYRKGKTHFDETVSRRVAEILEIHPGFVMLDMQRERASTEESRNLWSEIAAGFPALLLLAKSAKALRPTR